jgi:hypothetical protein
MELSCMEQPFLNYAVVTSGYIYTSLTNLYRAGVSSDLKFEFWAGTGGAHVDDGSLSYKMPIFLVHWAGIWKQLDGKTAELPYVELWQHYRNLNFTLTVPL